jgi:hypothetical protein
LTAAHCFFPTNGKAAGTAYFGAHETCFYGDCNAEERTIAKAFIHPNYNAQTSANDVAILKLASPITTIQPVAIKQATFAAADSFGNGNDKAALTLGWGVINTATEAMGQVLQQGNVNMVSRSDCGSKTGYSKSDIKAGMVCANHPRGTDACQGDSGGPLFSPSLNTLIGVVSWGQGCGEANYPGVYADVGFYYAWITSITGSLNGGGVTKPPAPPTQPPATTAAPTQPPATTVAPTQPPATTRCVCQAAWEFDGASYSGCAFTPDDADQAWCYTTKACAGSTPSQSLDNAQWALCNVAQPTPAPTTAAPATTEKPAVTTTKKPVTVTIPTTAAPVTTQPVVTSTEPAPQSDDDWGWNYDYEYDYDSDAASEACPAGAFPTLMEKGKCTAGSTAITSLDDCETAADEMELTSKSVKSLTNNKRPVGCYFFKNRFWFNKGGKDLNSSKRKAICCEAGTKAAPMAIGEMKAVASASAAGDDDDEMGLLGGEGSDAGATLVGAVVGAVALMLLVVGVAIRHKPASSGDAQATGAATAVPPAVAENVNSEPTDVVADLAASQEVVLTEDGGSIRLKSVVRGNPAYRSSYYVDASGVDAATAM